MLVLTEERPQLAERKVAFTNDEAGQAELVQELARHIAPTKQCEGLDGQGCGLEGWREPELHGLTFWYPDHCVDCTAEAGEKAARDAVAELAP